MTLKYNPFTHKFDYVGTEGGGSGFLVSLTGNTGGAVFGDGSGNINLLGSGGVTFAGDPGTNTINVTVINGGFTWTNQSTNFNAIPENGYVVTGTTTASLPATDGLVTGNTVKFFNNSLTTFTVQANTGQTIVINSAQSSSGGTAASSVGGATLELIFDTTGDTWLSLNNNGTWATA